MKAKKSIKVSEADLLQIIHQTICARIGTKWDLIMVSSNMPDKVKEFLEMGFEPFSITTQKVPKVDNSSKLHLVGEHEEINVIWMKRPDILVAAPRPNLEKDKSLIES